MDDHIHIQRTWHLTHPDGSTVDIDLWTDGYTVRVEGGDGEDGDRGQRDVDELIAKYLAAGYQRARDYTVNDPEPEPEDTPEPDADEPADRPECCPECGSAIEYQAEHADHGRSGPAWLCLGCRWGEWISR
ncbi:hypothetical protein ACFYY2_17530 [Streptomyces sp. NPDC001822]|uniref:hypothetical protein n=1 Tax=Streptomyces sp. NPDC001822 TaxID=3364614 RepID=UPI00369A387F